MDLSRIYRDAVEDVRERIGDEIDPPALQVTEMAGSISRRSADAGTPAIAIDPVDAGRLNRGGLRSVFTAQIHGALTDTVRAEVEEIGDAVPDDYGDTEGAIGEVTVHPVLEDRDALLAYNPTTTELGVAPSALRHVDPVRSHIAPPLSTLLTQAVAHAHHNAPLYDHPGYTAETAYHMSDTDSVGDVDSLRDVFRDARDRFTDEHSIPSGHDLPALFVTHQTAGATDLDDGSIHLDGRLLEVMNHDRLERELQEWLKAFYDDALHAALQDRAPTIRERYAAHDPAVEVEQAYFDDFDDAAAKHRHEDHLIRFDRSKMRYVDPLAQEFRSDATLATADHELTHELDFANNHVTRQYWSTRPAFDGTYKEDFRNAVVEAITTFEQHASGGRQNAEALDVIDDPWSVPFFLRGILAIDDGADPGDLEYDPISITNPYEFGLYTALSVRDAVAQRYGADEADDRARDFLYTVTTSPAGMVGILERTADMRPGPNYLRTLRVYDEMAQETDDIDDLLAPAADSIADDIVALGTDRPGGRGRDLAAADEDRALALFYEGKAVLTVYDHRGAGFPDGPQEMDRLDTEISELQQWYG